jgi:acetyltransferase-like isoleucine patch superfamily enzyme
VANLVARVVHAAREGTVAEKVAVRRAMFRAYAWSHTEFILWHMGYAPWQCRFKAAYLRRFGAEIGEDFYIERGVTIRAPEGLKVGNHSGIGALSVVTCGGGVTIGNYVMIGYGCRVMSANHRVLPVGEQFRYAGHTTAPVTLMDGCWLGTNTIVLPGVTVGEGAVVAAGSLVTRDVADFSYVGGVPARFMFFRKGYKPRPQE